jgi:Na+-transporting NADH:ubiquinone oxidoreductase subunit A
LLIKEGDTVQIGSPLYTDKKQPHVVFLSPASGVVEKIELGDRRSIEKIIIKRSENEESVQLFEPFNQKSIDSLSKENAVNCLTQGGVWMLFKQYPFNTIPNPDELPPSIYVSIDYDEPHMPDSSVF